MKVHDNWRHAMVFAAKGGTRLIMPSDKINSLADGQMNNLI